ncbi:MAG: hypothetical protein WDN06_14460 [Asticcacaulis sp.]
MAAGRQARRRHRFEQLDLGGHGRRPGRPRSAGASAQQGCDCNC